MRVALPLAILAGGAMGIYVVARLLAPRPVRHPLPGAAPASDPAPVGARILSPRAGMWGLRLPGRNAVLAAGTTLIFGAALGALMRLAVQMRAARFGGQLAATGDWVSSAGARLPEWGPVGQSSASGNYVAALRAEPGALVIGGVALALAALVAVYSGRYLALDRRYETYYPLLILLVAGITGMVLSADLFSLYLFCELMSLAAYALVSFRRHTDTAIEAGFKYLIMGSVGTILLLMGISFIFRARGHLLLPPLLPSSSDPAAVGARILSPRAGMWERLGLACVMVGLAVKSAIVPLHTWLPDAHGRAPSSVSAMLSGIVIQSTFYALLKISLGLGFPARALGTVLMVVSLFNMTLGNGLALVQTNTKRLLAYSTIAQMGYMMLSIGIGLRYNVPAAVQAGFFLLIAHAAMKGLAFLSKGVCHFYNNSTTIVQLRGTYRQLPLVAVTFSLALAGLAGVPPLAGFAGKWFILTRALQTAQGAPGPGAAGVAGLYAVLALFLLNSLAALGYFLPLIGTLFVPTAQVERHTRVHLAAWMTIPLVILGALVLALGVHPGPWLGWLEGVSTYLLGS